MRLGEIHDRVHLACHARIMHGCDYFGPWCDGRLHQLLVHVHGIWSHVDELEASSLTDKGRCRRRKGERREYYLIARLYVAQCRCHLQCTRAARGKQGSSGAEALLKPGAALMSEGAIATYLQFVDGLLYIGEFSADVGWHVKGNHDESSLRQPRITFL